MCVEGRVLKTKIPQDVISAARVQKGGTEEAYPRAPEDSGVPGALVTEENR